MAIYHLNMAIHSRGEGHSSVAAAAYRAGEKLLDERTGEVHDFTKKSGIEHKEIVTPQGINTPDRAAYWNAVEAKNKRSDAQICRDIKIALPAELSTEERIAATREFSQHLADKYSIGVDIAIHTPHRGGDTRNHHAHLLVTTNKLEAVEYGEIKLGNKVREFDNIAVKRSNGTLQHAIEYNREKWADICNRHLALAGKNIHIDHRSYKEQGIDKTPTIHIGKAATAMERRGVATDRGNMNREIYANSAEIEHLQKALQQVTKELEAIRQEKDIHESSISKAFQATKKSEKAPQSIADFISKPRPSIANTTSLPKEKPQEQASYFPTQERILEAVQKGTEQQARNVINQLWEKAQDKDAKKEAGNKEKGLEHKQRISEAQRAFELAQHEKAILTTEKENLGMFAKLQYKAGKHGLNEREKRAKESIEKATNELIKANHSFDEYIANETGPGGQTYRECKQHNAFIVPKAREALPLAEKAYRERVEKGQEERERVRMKVKVREPERGRGR